MGDRALADEVMAWVEGILGQHTPGEHLSVNDRKDCGGQWVRRVRCSRGRSWVVKCVAVEAEWHAEVHAYHRWVPGLAGHAPTLLAADADLRALLLSEVDGERPGAVDLRAHRQAGAVLRRLHDSRPARERPPAEREGALRRVERLLAESRDVLTPLEQAFVRSETEPLGEQRPVRQVPCHGDFRSHNWLVDPEGTLRVIDFGKARWEAPAWDLTRLFLRPWWRRPGLARAFLTGYGRLLDPDEADFVERRMVVDALSHVAFGTKRASERHVVLGRERLAELMAGHRVVRRRLVEAA